MDSEVERLMLHSQTLNEISYGMAVALGYVKKGNDFLGDPFDLLQDMVERLDVAENSVQRLETELRIAKGKIYVDFSWSADAAKGEAELHGDDGLPLYRLDVERLGEFIGMAIDTFAFLVDSHRLEGGVVSDDEATECESVDWTDTGWVVRCTLKRGHVGLHRNADHWWLYANDLIARAPRCPAVDNLNQCTLAAGHAGEHDLPEIF